MYPKLVMNTIFVSFLPSPAPLCVGAGVMYSCLMSTLDAEVYKVRDLMMKFMSEDPLTIREGLEAVSKRLPSLSDEEFSEAFGGMSALFYVDASERPDLLPLVERAEEIIADAGPRAIPLILSALSESDLKTHFHLAAVLSRMGHAAVTPLVAAYPAIDDDYARTFVLYALGKVRDRKVLDAADLFLRELDAPSTEVRDTAARALGKVAEHVNPDDVPDATRRALFARLMEKTGDKSAGVRAKCLRSLGKMARYGLLTGEERQKLQDRIAVVSGERGEGWDVAYIVRAEAYRARQWL